MGDAANSGDMLEATGGAGLPREGGGGGLSDAAGPLSIASLGLSVFGSIEKGKGTKASYDMQADRAQRAAEFGKLQASLTDTAYRENLNTTLSNIDVIRGAARLGDPNSPTGSAVAAHEAMISDRNRNAAGLTIRSQIAEDEASADYLRKAGDYALNQSYLDAGIKIAGAVAKAAI
jgi:hypothetical protein